MRCIYCADRRADARLTLEHIWPQSLGGARAPVHFQTSDVCQTCNNLAGQWVDGGFKKSWFVQSDIGTAAHRFLDPERPSAMPLVYFGYDDEFPLIDDHVCERWAGPAGAHVYHIHRRDDPKWAAFAGGDFIRRNQDAGRVYVIFTSPHPYWIEAAVLSVNAAFPNAKRRCLTPTRGGPSPPGMLRKHTAPVTPDERREIKFISNRPPGVQAMRFSIDIDFSDRFIAKLALGLGHTILGPGVSASPYADQLRRRLWRQDDDNCLPDLRGSGFWDSRVDALTLTHLAVPGAWTILLQPMGEMFGLMVIMPNGKSLMLAISDDPTLWTAGAAEAFVGGKVYVAVPSRERFIGPISLMNVVAHRLGNIVDTSLAAVEALSTDFSRLPPMRPEEVMT